MSKETVVIHCTKVGKSVESSTQVGIEVEAYVKNGLAAHYTIGKNSKMCWSITHLQSGMYINHCIGKARAMAILELCLKTPIDWSLPLKSILSSQKEAFWQLAQDLRPKD